ncbi:MAG: hypothetical protein J07HX5_00881 [halophilic archaeon J07HX5]|nr:MAG: hypothetical protein J07HX5_00881 [halophilic archaeon J07HX5]
MEVAFRGTAVAEVTDDGSIIVHQIHRPGQPRRVWDLGSNRHRNTENICVLGRDAAGFATHPVQQDLLQWPPVCVHGGVFTIAWDQPVLVVHRERTGDLCGLLPRHRRIGAHPTLSLETDRPLVEVPGESEVAVHLDEPVVAEIRHRRALSNLTVLVENFDAVGGISL